MPRANDPPRPLLRGYLHVAAAIAAPAAMVFLILRAGSPAGYVGAAIFGTSLLLLFAASANYHIVPWPPRVRGWMKRIDHSMIFAGIAGTYTPFCLQAMGLAWGITLLAIVWALAAAGMLLMTLWASVPRIVAVGAYLALGWVAVVALPRLSDTLPAAALAYMVAGGLLYTLGALVYFLRWPNPVPRLIGHHELFHALVVAGFALFYLVIARDVIPA